MTPRKKLDMVYVPVIPAAHKRERERERERERVIIQACLGKK
jgi:hypothetical protein